MSHCGKIVSPGFYGFNSSTMANKAVIMVSGGIDSTTLCYKAVREGYDARPITFVYGQRHKKEVEFSVLLCGRLGLRHMVADISGISALFGPSALTDKNIEIPKVGASEKNYETLSVTVVPNRNAVFLSLAVAYSQSIGCDKVFYGAHHSDRGVYPDCRPEFVSAFEAAERIAVANSSLSIEAPFVDMDKSQVVSLGADLGVFFEETWSCYEGLHIHCGSCSSCRERKRAFSGAGIEDPTEYEDLRK